MSIAVRLKQEFEECLELEWEPGPVAQGEAPAIFVDYAVEMVLDRSDPRVADTGQPIRPPKDALVKKVPMGNERTASIQNMPEGRRFLVSVVGRLRTGAQVRSPWIRAITLHPKTREADLTNLDPMNMPRVNCTRCPCPGYVPFRWALNTPEKMRCRRCGDHYSDHVVVEIGEILKMRQQRGRELLGREQVVALPNESLEWDDRECALWFCSEGQVHPRQTVGLHQPQPPEGFRGQAGGPEGPSGRKGRVSVVTPTMETRHRFHEQLWRCFEAQTWPDKELVVVETFNNLHSEFFDRLAREDPRVVYIKFQRPFGDDWSIGLKRNLGAHLATGEVIANFDDDDLYAPRYLETMVSRLQEQRAQAIKLSSWYIYDEAREEWGFCDPIAWGLTRGLDEESRDVRSWAYGYGFSYVFRRQIGLELWYDDINLGEDYSFISQLQARRGPESVALLHDDFGICLHIQHGGNTSDAIPLRTVERAEALDLDIMELSAHFPSGGGGSSSSSAMAGGLLGAERPPSQRKRKVLAHTPEGDAEVHVAVSATVGEFMSVLRAVARWPCEGLRVHRVPPSGAANATRRDAVAAEVLGIAFLAAMPGAEGHLQPDTKSGKQWRKLLEEAKRPMHENDRIGLRTAELWLAPPETPDDADDLDVDYEEEDFLEVQATCQKSSVKDYFSGTGSFIARIPRGSSVSILRSVLGSSLPDKAKILTERPDKGLVTLLDTEVCPERITVLDFKGNRNFYMIFTKSQCQVALLIQRNFFRRKAVQARLDEFEANSRPDTSDYGFALIKLLAEETYPLILRKFGLPEEAIGPKFFMDAMALVSRESDLWELWLEVEMLMRNKLGIAAAHIALASQRHAAAASSAAALNST